MKSTDQTRPLRISDITTVFDKLRDYFLVSKLPEEYMDSEKLSTLCYPLLERVPKRYREDSAFIEAFRATLSNFLLGAVLTKQRVREICYTLAGNLDEMYAGRAVLPPTSHTQNTPVLVRAEDVSLLTVDKVFNVRVRVLQGHLAGFKVDTRVASSKFLRRLLITAGLRSKRNTPKNKKIHPRHLYGCYLLVKIREDEDRTFVFGYDASSAMQSRNKALYTSRTMNRKCPYHLAWPCVFCPLGEGSCKLATHSISCTQGVCSLCGEKEYLNPNGLDTISLECQEYLW